MFLNGEIIMEPKLPYTPIVTNSLNLNMFGMRLGYRGEWVINVQVCQWAEVKSWCQQCLGEPGTKGNNNWRFSWLRDDRLMIRNKKSLFAFQMRWL